MAIRWEQAKHNEVIKDRLNALRSQMSSSALKKLYIPFHNQGLQYCRQSWEADTLTPIKREAICHQLCWQTQGKTQVCISVNKQASKRLMSPFKPVAGVHEIFLTPCDILDLEKEKSPVLSIYFMLAYVSWLKACCSILPDYGNFYTFNWGLKTNVHAH